MTANGRDMGGWGREPLIKRLAELLSKEYGEQAPQQDEGSGA